MVGLLSSSLAAPRGGGGKENGGKGGYGEKKGVVPYIFNRFNYEEKEKGVGGGGGGGGQPGERGISSILVSRPYPL